MTALPANIDKLSAYLERFRTDGILNLINGTSQPALSGAFFENASPVDESLICQVARGNNDDIDAAARAARDAFPAWRDMPALERKKILNRIADLIVERAEEIANNKMLLIRQWVINRLT